ncbi:MAG: 50S ribosomal protein L18 [Candidatus Aenigmarchaeota archaeon]|nr:50S ribosomal protein L18 [Candidatus Aenigmarchaeota archaeon]
MKLSPKYKMPFKRRREGKTDYMNRLRLLKSGMPRLVIRKSLRYITAQISDFDKKGDKTLIAVTSNELKKLGWNYACDNLPAGYLTGLLVGKKALDKKITEVVLDSGLYSSVKGSRIYSVVKGALDAGLKIPIDQEIMSGEERIKGEHIATNEKFKSLPSEFEKIKQKILGG